MGLFDKKFCDVCGAKIGLLGNRKLEDGNLCKECASKLSPFFSDRRRSTVADIKEQLDYRERNKADVAAFTPTRTLGVNRKVILDENAGKFIVTSSRNWKDDNPDVLDFSQVTGCNLEIEEDKNEKTYEDSEGNDVSYSPPRYTYSYDFVVTIHVNHPYFDEITVDVNDSSIDVEPPESRGMFASSAFDPASISNEYRQHQAIAQEIIDALTKVREVSRETAAAANAPKTAQTCQFCGATTIPDAQGRCEYCGGAMGN
ncbi:MAG: DUF4428 domain-containing protein [Acutalibacteraceae bacterium]|jgi:hypothetical protein